MTTIRLLYTKDRALCGFDVSGHAGAGIHGNDLVCAAISFLATTCVNALETVAMVKPGVVQSDGQLTAKLAEDQVTHDASLILKLFRQGARDLKETYPDNVRLKEQAQ